jgi:hypothetical protein
MKSKKPTEAQIEERVKLIRLELSLLFQRFNYFLIGASFLLISFATVASSIRFYPNSTNTYFIGLAGVICVAGCWLSFFFAAMNHLSSIIMEKLGKMINDPINDSSFISYISKWAKKPWRKIGKLLWPWGIFSDIGEVLRYPFGKKGIGKTAPHTYLVPFGFAILWFILLVILCFSIYYTVLLEYLHPSLLAIVVLLIIVLTIPLVPIYFYLCEVKKIRQKPRGKDP